METFKIIYSVLGGLGIFFFGMKSMSESLQAIAGDAIKNIINSLTSNRIFAVFVGTAVTMLVQSSSVTTVMVVGLVNAGLMELTQALGVIFGANIGTTITGWIISIKVGKYGLLLIGLGIFPMLFAKKERMKSFGMMLFGIGMIFFGLEIMSNSFKPLRTMPSFLDAISYFSGNHYGAYLASMMMGCLLTIVIQSSSAMLGITIALASTGVISFSTAAALVLGENIGTTITAYLASVGGNIEAKRAAKAHAIFNLLGVGIVMCIFPIYVDFIEMIIPGDANFINAAGDKPNIAIHIATGHTIFNVTATLLFLPFINQLANLVKRIHPDTSVKEQHHLVMLGNPSDVLPATAIVQAETENQKFKEIVDRMLVLTTEYLKLEKSDARILAKIKDYERITDSIQKEVTVFCCKVMVSSLTPEQSSQIQAAVRVADELESVADYLDKLATNKTKFLESDELKGEAREDFLQFLAEVTEFYYSCTDGLTNEDCVLDEKKINSRAIELKISADEIRAKHVARISDGTNNPLSVLTYSDMIVALRKVRSHGHNIAQATVRSFKGVDY